MRIGALAAVAHLAAHSDPHLKGRPTHLFRGDSPRCPDVRFIW